MFDLNEFFVPDYERPVEMTASEVRIIDGGKILEGVREFFAPDGPLRTASCFGGRDYEPRPSQVAMAEKIAEALGNNTNLCVEAPTGIGKSFAYLIAGILYAQQAEHPVLISTETINLQEQLIEKDIPLIQKITGLEFKAALAKGRGNYLCLRRLSLLSGDQKDKILPAPSIGLDIERLRNWAEQTPDGNRDSLQTRIHPSAWGYVCSEGGNCLGPRCAFYRRCFYWKARLEWEEADIIIANHALFLTDLKIRQVSDGSLLPNYSAVVIDEAHTLENNAAEHLGMGISQNGMNGFFNRLFNPDIARGLLLKGGEEALELRRQITEIRNKVKLFFGMVAEKFNDPYETILRIREPDPVPDNISPLLSKFRQDLAAYIDLQEDKNYKTELSGRLLWCDECLNTLSAFLQMSIPDYVYWIERTKDDVLLQAAPLNVGQLLKDYLFSGTMPVILSSATLTVDNDFKYFTGRIGFSGGETMQLDSPFHPDQVTLCIPRKMPDPADLSEYAEALKREIPRFLRRTHGKAFVLFTSYTQLKQCAESLQSFFTEEGIRLLVQGGDLSRSAMLREFKNDVDSVIFGTDSFWTGVDVPGNALSNVIIAKLPFPVPTHPLIAARGEVLKQQGQSDFLNYSLPEAVLKFRQGVGRLIRSRTDSGIVVVLDPRIVTKRYGRLFLASLPPYPIEYC